MELGHFLLLPYKLMKVCRRPLHPPSGKWQLGMLDDRDRARQLISGFFRTSLGNGDLGQQSVRQCQISTLRRRGCDLVKPRRLFLRPRQLYYRKPIFAKIMRIVRVEDRFHDDATVGDIVE